MAPIAAPAGRVVIQAAMMCSTVLQLADRLMAAMPNMALVETWVVDTGMPARDATITRNAVVRVATRPWPVLIAVIFFDIVSATLRALTSPPAAMAAPTIGSPRGTPRAFADRQSARILGVSLSARAKQIAPAETKCRESSAPWTEMPAWVPR